MTRAELRVEGAPELARGLDRVADELGNLSEPGRQVTERVAQRAQASAPRDTGYLASTIRVSALADVAMVEVGAPYAAFVEFGVPSRNMPPQPFLSVALEAEETHVVDTYADYVQHLLDRVEGT